MIKEIKPLHEAGFSILWLQPRSKRPVESSWTKGPGHDFKTLEMLYKPGFNVGVRLGNNSKLDDGNFLSVIDCDVKSDDPVHSKEMERALDSLGFDWVSAPTVKSGRGNGSRHIYCKTTEPLSPFIVARSTHLVKVQMPSSGKPSKRDEEKLSLSELDAGWRIRPAWEISAMGTGQQVVLPPSIHPDTGGAYAWTRSIKNVNDIPLVELSKDVKAAVRVIKDAPEFKEIQVDLVGSSLLDWVVDLIMSGKGILEKYNGDRSGALMGVIHHLINAGFTDEEMMSVLTDPDFELSWVAYDHTKSKDRKRAAQWVYKYNIAKARHERSAEKAFNDNAEIVDQFVENTEAQEKDLIGDWTSRLDRNLQTGKLKATLKNIDLILTNYTSGNIFYHDEFLDSIKYEIDPPWSFHGDMKKGTEFKNHDVGRIKIWLGTRFGFEPSDNAIVQGVVEVAKRNKRHVVRDYLNGLKWDGVKRLDSWLETYMNAEGPREYLEAIGSKLLCAAVGRVMEPGSKWDYVVIFEGKQGIGKSTACNILGSPWFTDSLGDISTKDVVDSMRGQWIIEIGELASLRKFEVETLKHFITMRCDRVRKAYAQLAEDYPRQCIFIGTTNREDYLKDETGNRRFWPVKVHQVEFAKLKDDRDQLWAEAFERWVEGEALYLSKELEEIASFEQAKRVETDEWAVLVEDAIKNDEFLAPEGFRMIDLWKSIAKASDLDGTKFSNANQHRLGRVLRLMGGTVVVKKVGKRVERRWFLTKE